MIANIFITQGYYLKCQYQVTYNILLGTPLLYICIEAADWGDDILTKGIILHMVATSYIINKPQFARNLYVIMH